MECSIKGYKEKIDSKVSYEKELLRKLKATVVWGLCKGGCGYDLLLGG